MEEGHGKPEMLISPVSAVRIGRRHRFPAELIIPDSSQTMSRQGRSHFERDAKILQPGGEGTPQSMEMEIRHFRLVAQSWPEDAKRGGSPSPEDSPSTWAISPRRAS